MKTHVAQLILAILVVILAMAVWRGLKRRGWTEGRAKVLSVTFTRAGESVTSSDWYTVTAEMTTREGRTVTGTADGFVDAEAKAWLGTTRRAWYDPNDPERFTVIPPLRERRVSGDDVLVYGLLALMIVVAAIVTTKVL